MRFKNLQKTIGALVAFLGFTSEDDLPINAQTLELELTEDQREKLKGHFGEEFRDNMLGAINSEIKEAASSNQEFKAIKDELDAIVKEKVLVAEELQTARAEGKEGDAAKLSALTASFSKLEASNKQLESDIKALIKEGVGDQPEAVINRGNMNLNHSATHLFASGKEYDKFENRPWNARLRDGGLKATDFNTDGNIPLLQDDLEHFVRENPTVLNSLFNDYDELPTEWSRRSGVLDRVASGFVIPGEIVQGRSKGWKPKNNFKIGAEEGRVFPKKIDITFEGYELQQIETTWLRNFNKEGSHPWKMSFIGFLLSELVKRQKLDDRVAQINGIYAKTPDGDGIPGAAVNSQDGLRFLFWYHRDVTKKYRATDLGAPTEDNIVDYVRNLILSVPELERSQQGLEFGLSQAWLDAYRVKAGPIYQLHRNTDQGKQKYDEAYPIDYPNIKFQPLRDMAKTDFMYITLSKNIEILDYNVAEKGKFTITHDRRDTHIFADYRLGIRLVMVGVKLADGDPAEFERQAVWSNSVPVFDKNTTVPLFDDETGVVPFHYYNMKVDSSWKTNITELSGAPKGAIVRITGNTGLAAAKSVVDNANFDLAGNANFDLSTGGTLTLKVLDTGVLKEIKRTTAPESGPSTDVTFTTTSFDANSGNVFRYAGANANLASILNGTDEKIITIYGGAVGDLTVADVANNIEVASNAVLATADDYLQLQKIDGVWYETKRVIA